MTLQHFCSTLRLSYGGVYDIMRDSMKDSLEKFWKSITFDDRQIVGRDKLNCIQHPTLRYFAAFLTRGILVRDNALGDLYGS
jgi:hypothetical protein